MQLCYRCSARAAGRKSPFPRRLWVVRSFTASNEAGADCRIQASRGRGSGRNYGLFWKGQIRFTPCRFGARRGGVEARRNLVLLDGFHIHQKLGLLDQPHFPEPFHYLIENPATGGAPLREQGRSYASIYEFGRTEFIPKPAELAAAKDAIRNHLAQVMLEGPDRLARDLFLDGHFLAGFFERMLAQGLYSTSLFDNWAQCTQPAALVVGNPVFEGYALHAARKRAIPTVLLQHGILGDFCQFVDPPVDHYIVRGWFWREFLAPAAASRAKIFTPPQPQSPVALWPTGGRSAFGPIPDRSLWHARVLASLRSCGHSASALTSGRRSGSGTHRARAPHGILGRISSHSPKLEFNISNRRQGHLQSGNEPRSHLEAHGRGRDVCIDGVPRLSAAPRPNRQFPVA